MYVFDYYIVGMHKEGEGEYNRSWREDFEHTTKNTLDDINSAQICLLYYKNQVDESACYLVKRDLVIAMENCNYLIWANGNV